MLHEWFKDNKAEATSKKFVDADYRDAFKVADATPLKGNAENILEYVQSGIGKSRHQTLQWSNDALLISKGFIEDEYPINRELFNRCLEEGSHQSLLWSITDFSGAQEFLARWLESHTSIHHQLNQISDKSRIDPDVEAIFNELAEKWRKETGRMSRFIEQVVHPSYQRIIGLGKPVIPILLRELQQDPDEWFWALESITGEDPTNSEDAGDIDRMAASWIRWGKQKGFIQ